MKNRARARLILLGSSVLQAACGGAYSGESAGGGGTAGSGGTAGMGGTGGAGGHSDAEPSGCTGEPLACIAACFSDVGGPGQCVDGKWQCGPPWPVPRASCPPPYPPPQCANDSPYFDCCAADGVDVPAECLLTDTPNYFCPANTSQVPKGKPCPGIDAGRDGSLVRDADARPQGCADVDVIDDMEDGDNSICPSDGRNQVWYWTGQAAVRFPTVGPLVSDIFGGRGGSSRALHFAATGLESPTGLATDLKASASYDASRYQGVEFWVRVLPEPNMKAPARIIVGLDDAGTCTMTCSGIFRAEAPVISEWTHQRLLFSDFAAPEGGAIDPARLKSLQFLLYSEDYEAWIDDVAFVPK